MSAALAEPAISSRGVQNTNTASHSERSIAWGVFATALLANGFVARRRAMRLAGLALLGLTAGKLLIVDLAELDQIYRVLSFAVVGVTMIGVSFAYHRADRHFASRQSDT